MISINPLTGSGVKGIHPLKKEKDIKLKINKICEIKTTQLKVSFTT